MGVESNKEVYDFLEHYGVRGMQWGVRRNRRTSRLSTAAKSNSSVASRVRALGLGLTGVRGRVGPVDLIKGGGIRGGAKRKVARERAREKRRVAGQASVKDTLIRVGSTRVSDLVPVRDKNVKNKSILDNDKAVVAAGGALFVAGLLARSAVRRAARKTLSG